MHRIRQYLLSCLLVINTIVSQGQVLQRTQPYNIAISEEEAWPFLRRMYNSRLYEDYYFLEKYCSPNLLERLKKDYQYEGDGYAVWEFRSGYQDGQTSTHILVNVKETTDGWFVYQGIDMGWLFERSVLLSNRNGRICIEDLFLGDISERYSTISSGVQRKVEAGTIPKSVSLNPTISGTDFIKLLGFNHVDSEFEWHIIENDLVNRERTRQVMSINTCYGGRSWYDLYFIDLVNRSYSLFGSYFSIEFDSSFFTTVKRRSVIVNEDMDFG